MTFRHRSLFASLLVTSVAACSVITNLDDLVPRGVGPQGDGGGPDQTSPSEGGSEAGGDAGPSDPWTFTLPVTSTFSAVAADGNGDVYLAGYLSSPLTLGSISVPAPQGEDVLVMKLDGKTRQPVWVKTYGGSGDDVARAMVFANGALYIVGTSASPSIAFTKTTINIQPSTGSTDTWSFVAKVDPIDGSAAWALSPDTLHYPNTAHSSICTSIAVKAKAIVVGCSYSGANFGFGQALPTPQGSGIAIGRLQDGNGVAWQKALIPGSQYTSVTFDDAGDTWLGSALYGQGVVKDDQNAAVLTTMSPNINLFALKISDTTQAISPVNQWTAGKGNLISSSVTAIAASGSNVFLGGQFIGAASLGKQPLMSAGGFDGFVLRLGNTTLDTQAQYILSGSNVEGVSSLAVDDKGGVFMGFTSSSSDLVVGGTAIPGPPAGAPNLVSGMGHVDSTGAATTNGVSVSTTASVRLADVKRDANHLYGAGTFQGPTTFDDGTKATGTLVGSGYLVRRAPF